MEPQKLRSQQKGVTRTSQYIHFDTNICDIHTCMHAYKVPMLVKLPREPSWISTPARYAEARESLPNQELLSVETGFQPNNRVRRYKLFFLQPLRSIYIHVYMFVLSSELVAVREDWQGVAGAALLARQRPVQLVGALLPRQGFSQLATTQLHGS